MVNILLLENFHYFFWFLTLFVIYIIWFSISLELFECRRYKRYRKLFCKILLGSIIFGILLTPGWIVLKTPIEFFDNSCINIFKIRPFLYSVRSIVAILGLEVGILWGFLKKSKKFLMNKIRALLSIGLLFLPLLPSLFLLHYISSIERLSWEVKLLIFLEFWNMTIGNYTVRVIHMIDHLE